jgi:hypothetical protein
MFPKLVQAVVEPDIHIVLLKRIEHGRLICRPKHFESVAFVIVPADHITRDHHLRDVPIGNLQKCE